MAKTCAFKAEIRQMLDLVIHSLYSKKEIFLRELISNASDAIDRAKYLALTDSTIAPEAPEWSIRLVADAVTHTLTIEDNGIGMSAQEAEEALGTIAKSGSLAFKKELQDDDWKRNLQDGIISAMIHSDQEQLSAQLCVGYHYHFFIFFYYLPTDL